MDEAARVRVSDGVGDLDGELHRAAHVHRPPGHLRAQRLSFQELEGEVDAAFVLRRHRTAW